MWILADQGFISIVEHQDDMNVMQVRSRVKADISNIFPNADVYEHDGADYLFRANISREEVANVIWEKVMTLDYTSHVKDVAIKRSAPAQGRSAAYYATWTAMSKMQPVPPYQKKNAGKWHAHDDQYQGQFWSASAGTTFTSTTVPAKPSAGSLASVGVKVPADYTTTIADAAPENPKTDDVWIDTKEPEAVEEDGICRKSMDYADDICDCNHTALVHPGVNNIDACILCELDAAYYDYVAEEN